MFWPLLLDLALLVYLTAQIKTYTLQGFIRVQENPETINFSAFFASALTLNHAAWSVIAGIAIEMGLGKGQISILFTVSFHKARTPKKTRKNLSS